MFRVGLTGSWPVGLRLCHIQEVFIGSKQRVLVGNLKLGTARGDKVKVSSQMWDFLEPVAMQWLAGEWAACNSAGALFLQHGALRQLLTAPHWQVFLCVASPPCLETAFYLTKKARIAGSWPRAGLTHLPLGLCFPEWVWDWEKPSKTICKAQQKEVKDQGFPFRFCSS